MTAIVMIRGDNGVVIAADGACYERDGVLTYVVSKVGLLPEINCVMAARGTVGIVDRLVTSRYEIADFEAFLASVCDRTKALLAEYRRQMGRHYGIELLFGGWSPARSRTTHTTAPDSTSCACPG